MTNETDFLDNPNIPDENVANIPNPDEKKDEEIISHPTYQDIQDGNVAYQDLQPPQKSAVKKEYYETLPDDKKYLVDDYGYAPPELYNGVDRNGKKVEALPLEGFEDLVKRGRIKPRSQPEKSQLERNVENLSNLVKSQNQNMIAQREADIDRKLAEAEENQDFTSYKQLIKQKDDINLEKLQLNQVEKEAKEVNDLPSESPNQQVPYSLEDQTDLEVFAHQNSHFCEVMKRSPQMIKFFDEKSQQLANNNPNHSLKDILVATKNIAEKVFNLKGNQAMNPNITNTMYGANRGAPVNNKPQTPQVNYNQLGEFEKKWVQGEARNHPGKSLQEVAQIMYGKHIQKK